MIGNRPEAGTRIIGQVAGHEMHLEIEDVLDKIKVWMLRQEKSIPIYQLKNPPLTNNNITKYFSIKV